MMRCFCVTNQRLLGGIVYETQRGYNLSEEGIDDEQLEDLPICPAGAMNKLIERFSGASVL